MKYFIILIITIGFFCNVSQVTGNEILDILEGRAQINLNEIRKDDPLYPSMTLVDYLKKGKNQNAEELIDKLESIFHTNNFSDYTKGKLAFHKDKFIVGTADSFRLWRELLFLCLGRAYYENNDSPKAIFYLQGIPEDSPFFQLAQIELGWAYLKAEMLPQLPKLLDKFKSDFYPNASPNFKNEFELLNSYYLVSIKDYEKAIKQGERFSLKHDEEQSNIQKKIISRSMVWKIFKRIKQLKL